MNPQDAIDLGRDAIKACFMVGGPILLASLVIGLLVGVVQAMTQVQDQTVSFVPKLLCMLLVVGLCLPWLTDQMVDFSKEALSKPMTHYHVSTPAKQTGFLSKTKVSNAKGSFDSLKPGSSGATKIGEATENEELQTPAKSPFSLPHYRYSRLPKENIDG